MVNTSFKSDGKMIFLMFFGLIIAATLIVPISDSVAGGTETITITNVTVTGATVNISLSVEGRELITQIEIYNASNTDAATNSLIGSGGSLQTGFGSDGLREVQLILNDSAAAFAGEDVNISYTANPDGYISNSGGRSITILITLFAALAALVFVIVVMFQNENFRKLFNR